jgi:hypothetical protein
MVDGRILTSAIMFVIFLGAVGMALTFPPDARFLPLVIGVPGLLMSAIQLALDLKDKGPKKIPPGLMSGEAAMFGWFFLFVGGIIFFGFPYAGPLLIGAYLYVSWKEKWYICLGAILVAWGILYGLFEHFLGLPLFEGLVVQWFF